MAGVGPIDGPRGFDGLAKTDIRFLKLARQRPRLGSLLMRVLVTGTRLSPKTAIKRFGSELSEVDGKAIHEEDPKTLMAFFIEASRQGPAAPLEDYRLLGSDWGFRLTDITRPVHLWQGDADQMVPLHHAEWMASQLPNATVHRLAGEGHVSIQRHVGDILSSAAGSFI
jgi:pimeloyl-ACP methyl ester carboxylesterase